MSGAENEFRSHLSVKVLPQKSSDIQNLNYQENFEILSILAEIDKIYMNLVERFHLESKFHDHLLQENRK